MCLYMYVFVCGCGCVCLCEYKETGLRMQCSTGSRLIQSPLAAKSRVPEISQKPFNSAAP